jgi:hypothetical protein
MTQTTPEPDRRESANADGPAGGVRRRTGRASRWGLYLPLVVLAVIVAAWSGFWLLARNLVADGLDRAVAEAATRGDAWTCVNRTISGYPFRIEVRCADVTLTRQASAGVTQLSAGPILVIGQPHTPNHVIIQARGPLEARLADGARIAARWDQFEASRRNASGELERLSMEARRPVVTLTAASGATSTLSAQALEAHVRRNPTRPASEQARDLFLRIGQMASGELDALLGDTNPSDLDVQITATRSGLLGQGITPAALEAWRLAGGALDLTRVNLRKGIKQFEAKGTLTIDDDKRIAGRIEPSALNIDQFAGIRLRGGAMDLASALSGRPAPSTPDGLRPLPAIDIRGGRIGFGPIRLPFGPLAPLY